MSIAILSALPEEQHGLSQALTHVRHMQRAGRQFTLGKLHGRDVVLALSGIGKVAAATTTTALIEHFGAQRLVFTGVAGGLGEQVRVGDVVVVMDGGGIIEAGAPETIFTNPTKERTRNFLQAVLTRQ